MPNKTTAYSSFRFGFSTPVNIEKLEAFLITTSQIKIALILENNEVEHYVFNSTGANSGTAADYINILEF